MTDFVDETVPPDDDPDRDQHVADNDLDERRPEHDSKNPDLGAEPGAPRGQYGPTADYGQA